MYIFLYFFIQRFFKNSNNQENKKLNYSIHNLIYKIKPAKFKDLSEIIDHKNKNGMYFSEDDFIFNIYEQIYKSKILKTLENTSIDNKLLVIKNDDNLIKINNISNGDLMNDFNYQIDDN